MNKKMAGSNVIYSWPEKKNIGYRKEKSRGR